MAQGFLLQLSLKHDRTQDFGARQQSSPYPNPTSQLTTRRTIVQSRSFVSRSSSWKELLLVRLEPIIDPQLPNEQAGFRRGRSTVHQIVNLTDDIEEAFEKGHKAGVILVDLTAAYDTVWHQGLTLKLLHTIPDRHLVRFICTIISNRSFTLKTSDGQVSRLRRLKNGVPPGLSFGSDTF